MRIYKRTAIVMSLTLTLCLVLLLYMTDDQRFIAIPAFLSTLMVLWLWMLLWDRDTVIPLLDIGFICALSTWIYTVYPLVNYWVGGFSFDILSDYRLQKYQISPKELGQFHWRHIVYLLSFVSVYAFFRLNGQIELNNVQKLSKPKVQSIFLGFILLTVYFIILKQVTGIDYRTSYEPDAFAKTVTSFSNAPLFLLQISAKLRGVFSLFILATLFIIVSRIHQKKWLIILIIWILVEITHTYILKGDRGGMVFLLFATILLIHRLYKHLSMASLVTAGLLIFLFFNFMGLYRLYSDFGTFRYSISQSSSGLLTGANEFQALLGTAYDVYKMKEAGIELPWYLYIYDFISILPPQQILPFEKIEASDWYVKQIGLYGTGQGYMWGVITQSVIGLDWIELFLRGAVLGIILASFHNWYVKHQYGFFATLFYIYFCIQIYYSFRSSTFSFLTNLVWEVLPFYLIIVVASQNSKSDISEFYRTNQSL